MRKSTIPTRFRMLAGTHRLLRVDTVLIMVLSQGVASMEALGEQ